MVLLAVASVALSVVGPRILGAATDLIFAGLFGRNLPAGTTKAEAVDGLRARGEDRLADMLQRMDVVPGQGVDFDAVGRVLLLVLAVYVGASVLMWLQGYLLNDVVQTAVRRMRDDVETKINRLPLSYFDRQPRGELLSRVTNDIDNVSQTLQQTMSQLLVSLLTVVGVLVMMFSISPTLALIALVTVPRGDGGDRADHEALAGAVHRAVATHRHPQRPRRGDLHRAQPGQGARPPARGRGGVRGGERASSTRPASARSSSAA